MYQLKGVIWVCEGVNVIVKVSVCPITDDY